MRYVQRAPTEYNEDGTIKNSGFVGTQPEDAGKFVTVRSDIADFVSSVDGSVVRGRKGLREYERRTGMSSDLDSLREKAQRSDKPIAPTDRSRREIRANLSDPIDRMTSSGYSPFK